MRLSVLLSALGFAGAAVATDYSQYVNAFMGGEGPTPGQGFGGGDIFVGGARPFGVVKMGIDSTATNWSIAVLNGGWTPDGNVTAFCESPRHPAWLARLALTRELGVSSHDA
jgi:hypothetical protein